MADNTQFTSGPLHVSRLIQRMQRLHLTKRPVSAYNVAEKLGGLIDLSLSVSLANTLGNLQRIQAGQGGEPHYLLRQSLLREREHWVENLLRDCDPSQANKIIPLPKFGQDTDYSAAENTQPFARFYALQQSEMEHHIAIFQRQVRATLANTSAELAQLATLDHALFDIMAKQTRKAFGIVPNLVARHAAWHYQHRPLSEQHDSPSHPKWFLLFLHDMREILLAELDIRLQPVIGLIEARESKIGLTP